MLPSPLVYGESLLGEGTCGHVDDRDDPFTVASGTGNVIHSGEVILLEVWVFSKGLWGYTVAIHGRIDMLSLSLTTGTDFILTGEGDLDFLTVFIAELDGDVHRLIPFQTGMRRLLLDSVLDKRIEFFILSQVTGEYVSVLVEPDTELDGYFNM